MASVDDNLANIVRLADKAYQAVVDSLTKKGVGWGMPQVVGGIWWSVIFGLTVLRLCLSFVLSDVVLPVALEVVKVITSVRESGAPEFAQMAAAVMGEFLGVEIDPAHLQPGKGAGAAASRAAALGSAFLDTMANSFKGTAPIDPADGAANAKQLAGYGIQFATANAVMSMIAELVSDEHLTQLHELGDGVARNVGLPRLTRQGIMPLIHAAITQPYTRYVNALYRGKELSVGELLIGLHSARLAEQDVTRSMQELGYSDEHIAELKMQHVPKLTLTEVDSLLRWGKLDQAGAIKALTDQGWPETLAQQRLDALHLAQADHNERAYAAEIVHLAQQRMIDQTTFATLLDRLHLSEEEKQGLANRVGVWLENHHKALTLPELIMLLEHNLTTDDTIAAWLEQQGYSTNDQGLLESFVTQKVLDFQAAQDAKKKKAAAAAAKGHGTVPPPKG